MRDVMGSVSRVSGCDSGVTAIVVSYRPELQALLSLLRLLRPQVDRIVLVDNGSGDAVRDAMRREVTDVVFEPLWLDRNLGVASAQNLGIARALKLGAEYVILFDQDSLPKPDMVACLLREAERLQREGVALAAVGPRYVDARQNNPPPFIQIRWGRVLRQPCDHKSDVVEVAYLISSGCLIPANALERVGWMRDELFIDYVDIDWGLRARQCGLRSFGCCGALMHHQLGDQPIRRFGREFPARSPLRHYYMVRNGVWLYTRTSLPFGWKIADGVRLFLRFGFYVLFATPRAAHLGMMLKGVVHALRGRMGPLERSSSACSNV